MSPRICCTYLIVGAIAVVSCLVLFFNRKLVPSCVKSCLVLFFQVIPCYGRVSFLQRHYIAKSQLCHFQATLVTNEGFSFPVVCTNKMGFTFITGSMWKDFCIIYSLEVGQNLYFCISKHFEPRVKPENLPITHPGKFKGGCIFCYAAFCNQVVWVVLWSIILSY